MALIDEALSRVVPGGRPGTPRDVARAVLYLADPDNCYVTGHDPVVDGGMSAGNTPVGRAAEWSQIAKAIAAGRDAY